MHGLRELRRGFDLFALGIYVSEYFMENLKFLSLIMGLMINEARCETERTSVSSFLFPLIRLSNAIVHSACSFSTSWSGSSRAFSSWFILALLFAVGNSGGVNNSSVSSPSTTWSYCANAMTGWTMTISSLIRFPRTESVCKFSEGARC
jgi:hypothetical protein